MNAELLIPSTASGRGSPPASASLSPVVHHQNWVALLCRPTAGGGKRAAHRAESEDGSDTGLGAHPP
ncbi:MAG: hypothetical protein ACRC8Q_04895, partial [Aeromonas sp.]